MGSYVRGMAEKRIPPAFTALLAAAIPWMPRTAAEAARQERLTHDLQTAAVAAAAEGGDEWPSTAKALLDAARACVAGDAPAIACGVIGDATATDWPREAPAWKRRRDIGDDEGAGDGAA